MFSAARLCAICCLLAAPLVGCDKPDKPAADARKASVGDAAAVPAAFQVAPEGKVVYLKTEPGVSAFYGGELAVELMRQSVLIAARDGLGLQTRDESLREWIDAPADAQTLVAHFRPQHVDIYRGTDPHDRFYDADYDKDYWLLANRVTETEALSRTTFVDNLKQMGWQGSPDPIKQNGEAPAGAEALLLNMDELSQIAVLRQTHALIRADGESIQRLGALSRAYANLGRLTYFHWSLEHDVYSARALLYAQRMVAANPSSATALWHRAYAEAMAGLQGPALADLQSAQPGDQEVAPAWVALLEPFCKYQTAVLGKLSHTVDAPVRPLASYLAYLTVAYSNCPGAIEQYGIAAFIRCPQAYGLLDALNRAAWTRVSTLETRDGPPLLRSAFARIPASKSILPGGVTDLLSNAPIQLSVPERQAYYNSLIKHGAPAEDEGEPSLTALGRALEESTFALSEVHMRFLIDELGTDAGDFTDEISPLVEDHPYKAYLTALANRNAPDPAQTATALQALESHMDRITLAERDFYSTESATRLPTPVSWANVGNVMVSHINPTSIDLENRLSWISSDARVNPAFYKTLLDNLKTASPNSPETWVLRIRNNWNAKNARNWEKNNADQVAVAMELANKYIELKQWPDAERNLQRYLDISPDCIGYSTLADVYLKAGDEDKWLATENAYLDSNVDPGLGAAWVRTVVANHLMDKGDLITAVKYADTAAESGADWTMACDAEVHSQMKDYARAEELFEAMNARYAGDDSSAWYTWCVRTGQGNRAKAAAAFTTFANPQRVASNVDQRAQLALFQIIENHDDAALENLRIGTSAGKGATMMVLAAVLSNDAHDPAGRGAMLAKVDADTEETPAVALAKAAAQVIRGKQPGTADYDAAFAKAPLWTRSVICYALSRYFDSLGQKQIAMDYLNKSIVKKRPTQISEVLGYERLRALGLNPTTLELGVNHVPAGK